VLRAENIVVKRAGRTVLLCKEFVLNRSEILAVIGPTGSGKSTLLRSLALIDAPDEGLIAVDDRTFNFPDTALVNPAPPWPDVTVVFQDLFLWPHWTVEKNIGFPAAKRLGPTWRTATKDIAKDVGIFGILKRYPNEISRGQRQLVAIARAIALKPHYLLLDEVTASLDIQKIEVVAKLLEGIRQSGTGILLISHQLSLVRSAADRYVFVDQGRVTSSDCMARLDSSEFRQVKEFLGR